MTTLTIHIPTNDAAVISEISAIIKNIGGEIAVNVDEDLTIHELELLKSSYKEALLIQDGKLKGVPITELWND